MNKRLKFALLPIISIVFLYSFVNVDTGENEDVRVRYTLNDIGWKFLRQEAKNAYKKSFDDSNWLGITIPHDYNGGSDGVHNDVLQGRFDFKNDIDKPLMYKGPGWYRAEFVVDEQYEGKEVFIEFEAVSLVADVWVNGKKVGEHKGGYTAFSFDITDYIDFGKSNLIAVRADNSNNPQIIPWMADEKNSFPYSHDFAVYGGIYRDVWLTITDPVRIERVMNTPTTGGQAPSVVGIKTFVRNHSNKDSEVSLVTDIYNPGGEKISTLRTNKTVEANEEVVFNQSESALGIVQLWSPDNPQVYKVVSTLMQNGEVIDEYESVFGFRYFTLANGQAFTLNGQATYIKGVNRHQDMEGLGYAIPNSQHWADAKLLKEAGFNFVRHAHYPADPEFVKACDELGLMLWLEIPLVTCVNDDPAFLENAKQQLQEMIEQNYNNPSVIIWGMGNESDRSGGSEAVSNKIFSELVNLAKDLDPTRPTTGCNWMYESNQKLVDVYAPQDWTGWYAPFSTGYKPEQIIGEYGASIHYPNHSEEKFDTLTNYSASARPEFWSQEYGTFVLEYKTARGLERKDQFPGQFVWVGFDFASPRLGREINPIPFMNQKGLMLYDHKTKKDVYYMFQSLYRSAEDYPMVYIVSHSWTDRWDKPEAKDVWAYSNCDSVQLFNAFNDELLGVRTRNGGPLGNSRFVWENADVNYNVLYAEGWFQGEVVARDTIILQNLPEYIK